MLDLKRKMRTQSRHSATNSCGLSKSGIILLILTSCSPHLTCAGPISDRLDRFVSEDADTVIASFGSPHFQSTDLLRYSFNVSEVADFAPSRRFSPIPAPNQKPAAGVTSPEPSGFPQAALPCFLDFQLNEDSTVKSVAYRGPGCFEVVHSRTIPHK